MELINDLAVSIAELDFLIVASGSDSRAYEVLSKLNSHNERKAKVIIFHFKERVEGKADKDDLFNYKKYRIDQEIYCDIKNPSSSLEDMLANKFGGTRKIGIDISCFTKPYFYYLLKLLKERFQVSNLNVFYTEPRSYRFQKGLFGLFRTSIGPISVREIPGYPGQENRESKRKLIILLGFDSDLSNEITEDVSPNETIVVNGFPSYSPKFKDISLVANEKLLSVSSIKVQYAKANNPFDVYNLLDSIKKESLVEGTFLNIAPLGTKPMALGACLFALHNPDVRVVYPLPDKYEDKYSDECWASWVYELPLTM